jgi:hypothetical protein
MIILRKRTAVGVLLVVALLSYWRGGYVRGLQEEVWTAEDQLHLDIMNECLEEEQEASI